MLLCQTDCRFPGNITDATAVLAGHLPRASSLDPSPRDAPCEGCCQSHGAVACARKWSLGGQTKLPKLWLLQGTIVTFADGSLLQLYRTKHGAVYRATSTGEGLRFTLRHHPLPS
jgi:hypothetical protein